ncbi:uncharacterized protein PV06_05753 [Exophiala oligosperma]|uniref:Oxidoreductase n=1 Tax=Exophiala oligosperma TaxID=215243 RepID=A0A0D2AQF3_9EURO|nr:uncharacterized protein PV06_05753 [Exophiala oligosperma]KIW42181.1 hypothetical protein PV06_05753 [Exophiala oligosperma]
MSHTRTVSQSTLDLIDTAVITGGAGGIGRAMAERLLRHGKGVIIVGRTESKLERTASEIGATAYYVLDTGNSDAVVDISERILAAHPEVNCLVNNAGVQRPFQFPGVGEDGAQEYGFDLEKADQEIDTNIRGVMHLTLRFLPHLLDRRDGGVIMNVSSVLGFLPSSVINPVYNGTKAWVHFFTMNLRTQYRGSRRGRWLRVVEIAPPTVTTDLHRERTDPGDNTRAKNKRAMSVDEFMDEVETGWREGREMIAPGPAGDVVQAWVDAYGERYEMATAGRK